MNPFRFGHIYIKIEINILSHKAAETPYFYQTITTINDLWEGKNAQEMDNGFH